jgi:Family of unknown function (DUF5338)
MVPLPPRCVILVPFEVLTTPFHQPYDAKKPFPTSMKELADLLRAKYEKSAAGKRPQIRNEILVRQKEIVAELDKGWSVRAIWEVLTETKEITCSYKTFGRHVRRWQVKAPASGAVTPKKEKNFSWEPTPNKEDLI